MFKKGDWQTKDQKIIVAEDTHIDNDLNDRITALDGIQEINTIAKRNLNAQDQDQDQKKKWYSNVFIEF